MSTDLLQLARFWLCILDSVLLGDGGQPSSSSWLSFSYRTPCGPFSSPCPTCDRTVQDPKPTENQRVCQSSSKNTQLDGSVSSEVSRLAVLG